MIFNLQQEEAAEAERKAKFKAESAQAKLDANEWDAERARRFRPPPVPPAGEVGPPFMNRAAVCRTAETQLSLARQEFEALLERRAQPVPGWITEAFAKVLAAKAAVKAAGRL